MHCMATGECAVDAHVLRCKHDGCELGAEVLGFSVGHWLGLRAHPAAGRPLPFQALGEELLQGAAALEVARRRQQVPHAVQHGHVQREEPSCRGRHTSVPFNPSF